MNLLVEHGYRVLPIMSENAYATDTRFGRAADWAAQAEEICGEKVIHTIAQAEPIGPKKAAGSADPRPLYGQHAGQAGLRHIRHRADAGGEEPQAKRAAGAHRRIDKRRAGGRGGGIGLLMNRKGTYFVPLQQDDFRAKPTSCVADFAQILPAAEAALAGGSSS